MTCCCFQLLGIVSAVYLAYKFFTTLWSIIYPHILAKLIGNVIDVKTLGKWAVVTGATDGIGKGYAKELAKRGVNVLLISRSEEKLKATAEEIRQIRPNIEVKTLAVDFQQASPAVFRTTVANAVKDIEVGLLVNNVGMSYVYPEELVAVEGGEEFLQNIVSVNCVSALQMTRVVLPQMLARKKGAVVTISSAAAFAPMPFLSVYSATKIFVDYFSHGLAMEYPDSGIHFQVVHPFYVVTKMSGLKRTSFWMVDPDRYAAKALNTIGILNSTSGCLSHEIQRVGMKLMIKLAPASILEGKLREGMVSIKKKYFRNLEKDSKAK